MTDCPDPLVICYSRSGHSRRVAREIAAQAGAELIEIGTPRYRVPGLWMGRAIWDAARRSLPPLTGIVAHDLGQRPWVAVCGPVWADRPAAPLRSVLTRLGDCAMPVGIVLTCGRSIAQEKSLAACEEALGRPLAASVTVENAEEGTLAYRDRLFGFVRRIEGKVADAA